MLPVVVLIITIARLHDVGADGVGLCSSAPTIVISVDSEYYTYMYDITQAYIANRTQTIGPGYDVNFVIDLSSSVYGIVVINDPTQTSLTFVQTQFFALGDNGEGAGVPTPTNASIFPLSAAALGIIYNLPNVPAGVSLNLSADVLAQISLGIINWWNDSAIQALNPGIQLPYKNVLVVVRSDSSADTVKYTQFLAENALWKSIYGSNGFDSLYVGNSTTIMYWPVNNTIDFYAEGVVVMFGIVESIPYTIGYASLASIAAYGATSAALENKFGQMVAPSSSTIQPLMNLTSESIQTNKITLYINVTQPYVNNAYPAAFTQYILYQSIRLSANCCIAQEFVGLIDFALKSQNADLYATQNYLVPLTPQLKAMVEELFLENATCQNASGEIVNAYDAYVQTVQPKTRSAPAATPNYELIFGLTGGGCGLLVILVVVSFCVWRARSVIKELKQWVLQTSAVKILADQDTSDNLSGVAQPSMQQTKFSMWIAVRVDGGEKALAQESLRAASLRTEQIKAMTMAYRLNNQLSHNVARFVGAWFRRNPDRIFILYEYCAKGTLHEVLQMSRYRFDQNPTIKYSMAIDVAEGMKFLHSKGITHGLLNPLNCLVDSNWQVKVAAWAEFQLTKTELHALLNEFRLNVDAKAPLSRMIRQLHLDDIEPFKPPGDLYSYGLILFNIFEGRVPFGEHFSKDDDHKVIDATLMREFLHTRVSQHGVRPQLVLSDAVPFDIRQIILKCISEFVQERPAFMRISKSISDMRPNKQGIVDAMMDTVEAYMDTLEQRVEERTAALQKSTMELKKMTDRMEELLMEVLPPKIGRSLLAGQHVAPEAYDCATIFFSDIVGFTTLSSASAPMQVMNMLNNLWTAFDSVVKKYDAYKVETIGDAYMACSGLPERNGKRHVREIARVALELRDLVNTFEIPHRPGERLRIRAGVNSGPVTAGVIGVKMPHYCIFGDTVNTASRMESTSEAMKIQITAETAELVRADFENDFAITQRGKLEIKGKGAMITFWLDRPTFVQIPGTPETLS